MITILVLSLFALKKSGPKEIIEVMKEKEQSLTENKRTYNGEEMTEEEKNNKILHHVIGKLLKLHQNTTLPKIYLESNQETGKALSSSVSMVFCSSSIKPGIQKT